MTKAAIKAPADVDVDVRSRFGFHVQALLDLLQAEQVVLPLGDRVLVLPLDTTDPVRKKGLLFTVHDEDKDLKAWQAVVVAVGPGTRQDGVKVPIDLVPGDAVLVGRFVGEPIRHGGLDHRLVQSADVLAKLTVE